MVGGRKYKPAQIQFALECILAGFSNKEAIALFRNRFGNQDWGLAQLKYMRVTYGDHPDFGCCLVNRTEMSEAQKAALRSRLVAEARKGPGTGPANDISDSIPPKDTRNRSLVNHQSPGPASNSLLSRPYTPIQNVLKWHTGDSEYKEFRYFTDAKASASDYFGFQFHGGSIYIDAFLEDAEAENVEQKGDMIDPMLTSMDLDFILPSDENAFEMSGDSLLENFDFSIPDHEQGNESINQKSMTTMPVTQELAWQDPDAGVSEALMTEKPVTEIAPREAQSQVFPDLEMTGAEYEHGNSGPVAPMAEMSGTRYHYRYGHENHQAPGSHNKARFPASSLGMVENQVGDPPLIPYGYTEPARSGWDAQGWWYLGQHDRCPLPLTHRHDINGQVSFTGMGDVLKLVNEVMAVARRG
ncbi:hypothetical protein G7054_g3558 [Neopestalotiopsis clavispora]|nr:hypothetical protein G7054_g3558 [Neopestalotiopsis clavispora]